MYDQSSYYNSPFDQGVIIDFDPSVHFVPTIPREITHSVRTAKVQYTALEKELMKHGFALLDR